MMRPSMILAIARAEMRSVRRLMRYWMFAILSVFLTFLMYLYYSAIHGFVSRFSATIGAVGPRFIMAAMGIYVIAIFLFGLIFLAFDVRARDVRERMAEVLDSRPFSNSELLVGRSLGLVLMAWFPVLMVVLLLQTFGAIALMLELFLGEPVEPYSMLLFMADTASAFLLWSSVIVLLAVVLGNRMLVALSSLVVLGTAIWGILRMPMFLQPVVGLISGFGMPSDLAHEGNVFAWVLRRSFVWVLAAGLLALAAAFHPRPDGGSKSRRLALGVGLVVLAGILVSVQLGQAYGERNRRTDWLVAHQARADEPRADLLSVKGTVRIYPGRRVESEFVLEVAAPADRALETLLFTLNPGLEVSRVAVDGNDATFSHSQGLLEVTPARRLAAAAQASVEITVGGKPDVLFGYLDASKDFFNGTFMDSQIALLGIMPGIFAKDYVAMMPGIGWLPQPGSAVGAGDPRSHPVDYFAVDLEVEVPGKWLVAGPGRRESVQSGERDRFRFRPGGVVPEVGLLASRFERRAIVAAGVEVEILVNRKHMRNIRFFADAAEEIEDRVTEMFEDAAGFGLPYPYGGLTLVESPTGLRGYGGGWRMDTTQAMPGVLLLRENSFTTSRFEFEFRDPESFAERDGGLARAKVVAIERFFENDFSGGNVFLGGSRNFLLFQTSAQGNGSIAINFVIDELVNRLLTGKRGYFSPFMFEQSSSFVIGETITNMVSGRTDSIVESVLKASSDRPSVWDRALDTALADLDPAERPDQVLNVLALKSGAIASSILDGLGRDKTAALLAELLSRYRGTHFVAADLQQVALELDVDLEGLIGEWLEDSSLPGFLTSPVQTVRIADDAQGNPRYQTRVHVYNDETTPGLVRIRYQTGEETAGERRREQTEPVRVGGQTAIEIGLLSAAPPAEVWLQPYLSLNRQDIQLSLPRVNEQELVSAEAFLGSRPSEWRPVVSDDVIVDDLDAGFSIESDDQQQGVRLSGGLAGIFAPPTELDQGLAEYQPTFNGGSQGWTRREVASSWGKYRQTIAASRAGKGTERAVFAAQIPHAGRWRLGFHLPLLTSASRSESTRGARINVQVGLGGTLGSYALTLVTNGDRQSIEFDGAAGEAGWNALGEFDLPAGEVRLEVSDETSGRNVVVDAIRWQSVVSDG